MLAKIVVGTDGTPTAGAAVTAATHLAERLGSHLLVVHAAEQEDAAEGADILRTTAAACAGLGHRVETSLVPGPAGDALVDVAVVTQAELLVVGNRGMTGARRLLGSVPGHVSHHAPSNVLLVDTQRTGDPGFRRLLLATDGSPSATEAVRLGGDLARALEAGIVLTHVGSPEAGVEVLAQAAAVVGDGVPCSRHPAEGRPGPEIVDVAAAEGCDLIVVGNRGMTGARRLLGSVPDHVSHHAPCSVLIVKTT